MDDPWIGKKIDNRFGKMKLDSEVKLLKNQVPYSEDLPIIDFKQAKAILHAEIRKFTGVEEEINLTIFETDYRMSLATLMDITRYCQALSFSALLRINPKFKQLKKLKKQRKRLASLA